MSDFNINIYKLLLQALKDNAYSFFTFANYITFEKQGLKSESRIVILRHDVDLLPNNSYRFAKIQAEYGLSSTYNFRVVPESWDEAIIRHIADLGHEVGYHYENMDTCKGDIDKAWDDFRYNLDKLRKLVDVKTICMHGSPRSKFDNRDLWKKYDYRSLGIIGEPYYDVDFNRVFYLTDTGRRWDGWKVSVRDKVPQQEEWIKRGLVFHSTDDIIKANEQSRLPEKIMFTFHPQRWYNNSFLWLKEFALQKIKNQIKRIIIK